MLGPKGRFRNPGLLRLPAGSTRKPARSSCARPTYLVYAPRCSGARTAVHRRVTSLHIASDESRTAPIPFRCRHLVPVINTRRVTVEAGLHTVSVSQVTVNIDGIGLAFDATLAVGAQRARDCLEHMTCPYGLSMRKCCSSREVTQHAAGGNFPYDSRWRYRTTRRRHRPMDRRSGSGHAHVERSVFGNCRMVRGVGLRRVAR